MSGIWSAIREGGRIQRAGGRLQLWKIALGVTLPALHGSALGAVALNRLGADPVLVPDGSLGQRSRNR